MKTLADWPPRASDTTATIQAYERVLGWLLIAGSTVMSQDRAIAELKARPAPGLSTSCSAFDAVTVSHAVGIETMVLLDRSGLGPVPCLIAQTDQAVLLVQPGTGGALARLEGVSVESGPGGRLDLPPSSSRRWDTPPWDTKSRRALSLLAGSELMPYVRDALRLFGGQTP
jgi:hypothetical protein